MQKTFEQLGQEAMKHAGAAGAGPEASSEPSNQDSPDSNASDKPEKDDDIVDADFESIAAI